MAKKEAKKETKKNVAAKKSVKENKKVVAKAEKVKEEVKEEELKVVEVPEENEEEIIIKEITEKEGKKKLISKRDVIVAIIFLVIGVAFSILFINRVPKLKDGGQAVVSLKENSYSADVVYNDMKTQYGLNTVLRLIDLDLVKNYFDGSKDEDAKKEAEEQAETYIKQYTTYGYSEEDFLAYYGFKTKEEFIKYLEEDYLLNEYYTEYVKGTITEEEINKFYDNYAIGKKTIYIFSEKSSTTNLEAIRKALKKGTDIKKVVETYKDKVTINDALDVDHKSITSYSETIIEYIKATAKGKYSKVFTDSQFGNVVIYVSEEGAIPDLKDIKEDIINTLVSSAQNADNTLYYKAFIQLRKDNKIKFYDKDLKAQYNEYVKTYTAEAETEEEETEE